MKGVVAKSGERRHGAGGRSHGLSGRFGHELVDDLGISDARPAICSVRLCGKYLNGKRCLNVGYRPQCTLPKEGY